METSNPIEGITLNPKPITNQLLWYIAKFISTRQREALESGVNSKDIYWNLIADDWFDFLEETLIIKD